MLYILRHKLGASTLKELSQLCPDVIILKHNKPFPTIPPKALLRWGCTTLIPWPNCIVLNRKENIKLISNKAFFRNKLQENHPEITPKTWFDTNNPTITYPCILRPFKHSKGKHLWFCNNLYELIQAKNELYLIKLNYNYYISEYIPKVKEYRVCFIQGRVAWVVEKIVEDPTQIAWNSAQGSKFINVRWKQWPIDIIEACYKAYTLSNLWLGAVDVIVDKDGHPFVLEINTAPLQTAPYDLLCTARCINYGINNNFDTIPLDNNYTKYGKYLHPALKNTQPIPTHQPT